MVPETDGVRSCGERYGNRVRIAIATSMTAVPADLYNPIDGQINRVVTINREFVGSSGRVKRPGKNSHVILIRAAVRPRERIPRTIDSGSSLRTTLISCIFVRGLKCSESSCIVRRSTGSLIVRLS